MKVMIVLLGLAAVALGDRQEGCCSIEDRHEVLALWSSVWSAEFSGRRIAIAQAVFVDLFEHYPEAKALFSNVNVDDLNSPEFKAHCVRIMSGLDVLINLADDPLTLHEALDHLANQHATREGVKAEYFDYILGSFDRVLSQAIPCFNHDAWERCFNGIAHEISAQLA